MLNQLLNNGTTELPSIITNPFFKDKLIAIAIHGKIPVFKKEWAWYARIEFRNGKTYGEQMTDEHEDFNSMITEIKSILSSIK